jgi:DNA-binding CsgD family transcriptional regulator
MGPAVPPRIASLLDLVGLVYASALDLGRLPAAFAAIRRQIGAPASEVVQVLPIACALADQAGRCVERNASFDVAAGTVGLRLAIGRILFADPALHGVWETALSDTDMTALPHGFLAAGDGGTPWRIHLLPLQPHDSEDVLPSGKAVLVVLEELATAAAQPAIRSQTRLTNAEQEVLSSMLQGLPAKAIATRRGSSVNTIRSQIMAILDKTGHRSQKELMASVGNSTFGSAGQYASVTSQASNPVY